MDALVPQTAGLVPPAQKARRKDRPSARWIVIGLIVLGLIPVLLGIAHLTMVAMGADVSDKALYFLRFPLPIALHVIGAAVYVLLGPLQFSAGFRRRAPQWHRVSGRVLVVAGLLVALSALWMTLTLPHRAGAGDLLYAARLLFGAAMIAAIALGFGAIRRGNVPVHRRWMTRAYAIGLGAATQVPVLLIAEIIGGPPDDLTRAILMAAAWIINLAIAECVLRYRRPAPHPESMRLGNGRPPRRAHPAGPAVDMNGETLPLLTAREQQ
jgi:uncharacterized membrane protein